MTGYVTGWPAPAPGYWELPEKVGLARGQRFACMGSGHTDSEHQTNFLAIVHASGEVRALGEQKAERTEKGKSPCGTRFQHTQAGFLQAVQLWYCNGFEDMN